ncbi:MFS transporter [Mammaliicoccus vitulinus]|uniref:MFS transporter n=1 Tax=Mammaliicoccus vitulinus TaxID=71237 RepID=UPI0015F92DD3|nr:MFS transporter [Mammaliicoccus vitulinus]
MNNKINYMSYVSIYMFYFFALGIISTIMSIYLNDEGKTAFEISIIISSGGIFSIFIQPLFGYLVDKTQKTIFLIVLFLILASIFALLLPVTRETIALCLLYGFIFSLINAVSPINEKLATESSYKYGYIRIWGAIGFSLASQTSTLIYENTNDSFIFYVFSFSILFTLFGYTYLYKSNLKSINSKHIANNVTIKELIRKILFNQMFIIFLIINLLFTGMTTVSNVYLPIFLNEKGISLSLVGTIILVATLLEIPLILFSNVIIDKLSTKNLLLLVVIMILIQFSIYGIMNNAVIIAIGTILLKASSTMLFIMITLKATSNTVSSHFVNSALSLAATVKALGGILFQLFSGFFIDKFSIQTLYTSFIFFALMMIIILIFKFKISENENNNLFSGNKN